MLKKVDPSNRVLEAYLLTISTNDGTGVLLAKHDEGSSNKSRKQETADDFPEEKFDHSPKNKDGVVINVSKKLDKNVEPETAAPSKEIVPSKTGVFKRLKKKAHRSRISPERSGSFSPSVVHKSHVTRKGLIIREVHVPVSPASKKRRVEDMAKHLSKKKQKKIHKMVIRDDSTDEEVVLDSSVINSPITSNVETSVAVSTSIVSTKVSTPEQIVVTLPPVLTIETSHAPVPPAHEEGNDLSP
ncbi:unnamed protein product [Lactuca virosa]|uniref:Uncharacterized protein n=1 Tax=Lactuca virosa TaxID=75947 RepID=A0AAU9P1F5_9ASTR|nr:unnamed protein product [Lactuca virosa]